MRVCLVSRELAPATGWGVGTYAANMAAALMHAGDEVHILTVDAPGIRSGPSHAHQGAEVHPLDVARAMRHLPTNVSTQPLAVYEALLALHEQHSFDLIEFADVWADGFHAVQAKRTLGHFEDAVLAVRLHSPIFLLQHINAQDTLNTASSLVHYMEAETIRGADVVLAPSKAIADKVTSMLGGRIRADWRDEPTPVHHLANPYDPRLVYRDPPKTMRGPRPVILAYGRLEYRKGFHLLMQAATRLLDGGLDLDVRIYGNDTTTWPGRRSVRDQLERLVPDAWADRFSVDDKLSREQIAEATAGATVCCFPSLWENYPYGCIEAMALGALVVGSDAGGMAEIIEHDRSGLLFHAGDEEHLASMLAHALTSDSLQSRAADLAPKRVRDITNPARIVKQLHEIIDSIQEPVILAADEPGQSVAIVIPHKDMPGTLEDAVRSARDQSRPADEIIIVDDGSTSEAALALLDEIEAREGVRIIRQQNTGLPGARNAAIEATACDYVIPLDADDLLAPDFIECTLAAVSREPALDMVTTLMACFKRLPQDPEYGFAPVGFDRDSMTARNVASSCTALLRRSSVLEAGGYDESMSAYEDWDLYCAMATRDMRCALVPRHLVFNRIRADSMLRSLDRESDHALRARLIAKHPNLALRPDRALRLALSRSFKARRAEPAPKTDDLEVKPAPRAPSLARRLGLAPIVRSLKRTD